MESLIFLGLVGVGLLALGFWIKGSPRWLLRFAGGFVLAIVGIFAVMMANGDF